MSASRAPGAASQTDPPYILVVEDEILIRDMIATVLRDMGAVVAEAANGDEAWDYITAGFPVDLVFTDNRMPGSMTGVQLAMRIKTEHPRLAVVLVSAEWNLLSWAEPIVAKPYAIEETAAELTRRALEARFKD